MKKILLTNLSMKDIKGDNNNTLDLANYFIGKNYEVDIFTLENADSIDGYNIYTNNEVDKLSKEYDLILAHHFPLLDYLLFDKDIKAKHIVYEYLENDKSYDELPKYYNYLSKCIVNNSQVMKDLEDEYKDINNLMLYNNLDEVIESLNDDNAINYDELNNNYKYLKSVANEFLK